MTLHPTLYRSTLVAAAIAVGCLGAVSAASAHEHGERDGDRHGGRAWHAWHERGEHPGWGYYRPVPEFRPHYREPRRYDDRGDFAPQAYYPPAYDGSPVVVYRPAPRADVVLGGPNVSVMIQVPL